MPERTPQSSVFRCTVTKSSLPQTSGFTVRGKVPRSGFLWHMACLLDCGHGQSCAVVVELRMSENEVHDLGKHVFSDALSSRGTALI